MSREQFDLDSFQQEVQAEVRRLEFAAGVGHAGHIAHVVVGNSIAGAAVVGGIAGAALVPGSGIIGAVGRVFGVKGKEDKRAEEAEAAAKQAQAKRIEELETVARQLQALAEKPNIRRTLCPALDTGVKDVYDIAKTITPILASLSLAGTISVPLIPLVFALLAVLIARMGVASFWAGKDIDEGVKSLTRRIF